MYISTTIDIGISIVSQLSSCSCRICALASSVTETFSKRRDAFIPGQLSEKGAKQLRRRRGLGAFWFAFCFSVFLQKLRDREISLQEELKRKDTELAQLNLRLADYQAQQEENQQLVSSSV